MPLPKRQQETKSRETRLEAYRLEHEHYLSEFKILLTATLSIFFGIMIAIATGNLRLESVGSSFIFYIIIVYGLLIILGLIQIYRKILRNVRRRMVELGDNDAA